MIFSKEGIIFIVQVDHLNGEIMGSIFDMLYSAGALNVQCLQTNTKKNRPGNIFIIDVLPEREDSVESIIIEELGSTGWHRLTSDHRHVPTEIIKKDLEISVGSSRFTFTAEGKLVKGNLDTARPEHRNCMELKDKIKLLTDMDFPLKVIYTKLQTALLNDIQQISFNYRKVKL